MSEKTTLKDFDDDIIEFKDKIKAATKLEAGKATTDKKAMWELLTGDLTKKQIEGHQTRRAKIIAAGNMAHAELAVEAFKKDDDLTTFTGDMSLGKDKFNPIIKRHESGEITRKDENGNSETTEWETWGALRSKYKVYGGNNKTGPSGKVARYSATIHEEALKDD
ncbi:hypothetical protein [Endozoicomonas sp. ONNA1]|uniref:hypothetical protein n=1 Tax=Endozoicomonas sp. ONNA1 TaxID=2828740 RepID=UPI00214750CB|nr:hypothetical protein [Endozoicomonas sp. ONNA1]